MTALFLPTRTRGALFVIGGAAVGLLFIGLLQRAKSVKSIAVAGPHVDGPE